MTFCNFFRNGLVYNNNTTHFTVSPCCFYSKPDVIYLDQDIATQLSDCRKSWLNDDINVVCKKCIDAEKVNLTSLRQASFDACSGHDDNIEFLTVAVNKKCNLACASCNSGSSSFWYRENIRDGISETDNIIDLHRDDHLGKIDKEFTNVILDKSFQHLKYIKFGGGEPLMSATHEVILSQIKNPQDVTLQYTSNFSIMPSKRIFNLWKKFRLVKWCASTDGIEQQFEILRWPYHWNDFTEFVERAKDLVPHNVMFGVEHTLNPLNIWYFENFKRWFSDNFSANRQGDPTDFNVHICTGQLDLRQTPELLRKDLSKKLGSTHLVNQILDKHSYTGTYSPMVTWLDSLDQRRRTNWRDTFAEVAGYYA